MSGILRLESLTKGNTLRQGDKTPLKYRLFDADGERLNIAGKSAVVRLMYPDFLRVGYESEPLTVSSDNTVTFSIDKIIQPILYYLEITVDGKYIFPSRNDESKLNIDKSSKGSDVAIIEIIGKDVLVRDIKNMVDSEIEPVVNDMIVSNQKVIENEKIVKDVQTLSEQLEARQNQVEQFNNQVITEMTDKDVISAPEIISARSGELTLQKRLDRDFSTLNNDLTARGFNVTRFGAIGNGVNDDTFAIRNLYESLTDGDTILFPKGYNFRITDSLIFDKDVNVIMDSPMVFDSPEIKTVLQVGSFSSNSKRNLTHRIRVIRKHKTNWLSDDDIGVLLVNQFANNITVNQAGNFTNGVKCYGVGFGFVYNTIILNDFSDNKIHLRLSSSGQGGYVNENLFIGGRFSTFDFTPIDVGSENERRGILIESEDGIYPNNNNNLFIKPSLEPRQGTGIEIRDGVNNKVIGARSEFVSVTASFSNKSKNNEVDILYSQASSEKVTNSSDNSTNIVNFSRLVDVNRAKRVLVDRSNLNVLLVDKGTSFEMEGCSFSQIQAGGFPVRKDVPKANAIESTQSIDLTSYAVGVMLTTDEVKKFVIQAGYHEDSQHWLLVRCFDSDGNVLSNTQTKVLGGGRNGEYIDTYQFQMFRTAGVSKQVSFEVKEETKKIWIGLGHNTGPAKIKGFQILTSESGYVRVSGL